MDDGRFVCWPPETCAPCDTDVGGVAIVLVLTFAGPLIGGLLELALLGLEDVDDPVLEDDAGAVVGDAAAPPPTVTLMLPARAGAEGEDVL